MSDRIVWHITTAESLAAIQLEGLVPAIGPRSQACGETDAAIYFFDSPEDIANAMDNWLGESFDDDQQIALLEVDLPQGICVAEGAGFEVVVLDPIPASAIRVLSADLDRLPARFVMSLLEVSPSP